MDKYEYKVRAEEIKTLIGQKEYVKALQIADTIDWSRVRSVLMLCTVSDLYKINRRLEESRDILLMAYERNPNGRTIVYSLCELSIKLGDVVQAIEYYKEYVQLAPKDTGRYILQYKLYEAQEVGLEERIAVLEEFKKRDYREKWSYELAYLYHRVGLATRCVEECDDLILWFGEGRYVMKAMELKMLHEPLTSIQEKKYQIMKGFKEEVAEEAPTEDEEEQYPRYPQEGMPHPQLEQEQELDIHVKPMRVGQYDTINLQKELAENITEFLSQEGEPEPKHSTALEEIRFEDESLEQGSMTQEIVAQLMGDTGEIKPITPPEEDESEAGYTEDYAEEYTQSEGYAEEDYIQPEEYAEEAYAQSEGYVEEDYAQPEEYAEEDYAQSEGYEEDYAQSEEYAQEDYESSGHYAEEAYVQKDDPQAEEIFFEDSTAEMPFSKTDADLDPEIARMLSQEYDGQISLVVPESEKVEKQITGQMSIEDILAEWERTKKQNEEKRAEDVRKRVLEHTGSLFSEFDASTRSGILEQLEEAARTQADREEEQLLFEDDTDELEVLEEAADTEELEAADEAAYPEEPEMLEEAADPEELDTVDETGYTEEPEALEETAYPEESEVLEEAAAMEEPEAEDTEDLKEAAKQEREPAKPAQEKAADKEQGSVEQDKAEAEQETLRPEGRSLTEEEMKIFGNYIQTKKEKSQIVHAIDTMSLAPYTGNVIITGDTGVEKVELAKDLIKEVQQSDSNFSGKVAKISGAALNNKDIESTFGRISNGALIIEKAGDLKPETLKTMNKVMEKGHGGIILLMEDTRKAIDKMLEGYSEIQENFNARIDIEALSNDALVAYGKKYAMSMEYAIDDLGVLALYTRIADMQTSEHAVTASEVREVIDEAIYSANRKTLGHFKDVLLAKRYDDEDMIVLREKDFLEY